MIDKNYFKTMKSTFSRQHMVNDINDDDDDDDDDDMVTMKMRTYPGSST